MPLRFAACLLALPLVAAAGAGELRELSELPSEGGLLEQESDPAGFGGDDTSLLQTSLQLVPELHGAAAKAERPTPAQRNSTALSEGPALSQTWRAETGRKANLESAGLSNSSRDGAAAGDAALESWNGLGQSSVWCPIAFVLVSLAAVALIAVAHPDGLGASLSQEDIQKIFKEIDTDSSGELSVEEVKDYIKSTGHAIPDAQIATIVKMADKDNSGTLDCDEFAILLQNLGSEEPHDMKRCLLGEFVGQFLFQFFGGMPDTGANGNAYLCVALIYVFAPISGAHFNPAVTVAAFMARQVNLKKAMLYVMVNMIAAVDGALFLKWMGVLQISGVSGAPVSPCLAPAVGMPEWKVLVLETMATFTFIMVFLAVAVDSKSGWGNVGPLALGLTLVGLSKACGNLSGLSMNPARFFAPCIVYGCFPTFWHTVCYIVAALLAAALASSLYLTVFFDRPTPEQHVGMSNFQFMLTDNSSLKRALHKNKESKETSR